MAAARALKAGLKRTLIAVTPDVSQSCTGWLKADAEENICCESAAAGWARGMACALCKSRGGGIVISGGD